MRKVKSYNVFNESVRNTSVRDHMKPRSRKDIRDSIEKMSDEDYESYMVDEIVPYNKFNMIFNDTKYRKIYKEMIIDGKKKGIVPSDLAKQISDMLEECVLAFEHGREGAFDDMYRRVHSLKGAGSQFG